jgi:hypothetical protein
VRCPLTNPTTRVVTSAQTITLNSGEHSIIELPTASAISGKIHIVGNGTSNQRVWVIGGRINNSLNNTSGTTAACLDVQGVNIAYLEGLRLDKLNQIGDNLITRSFGSNVGPRLFVQNCLFIGANYIDPGIHGDGLQVQSQIRGLYMHRVTSLTYNQGFTVNLFFANDFASGPAILERVEWTDVNWTILDSRQNPQLNSSNLNHHAMFLWDSSSVTPRILYTLDNIWAEDLQRLTDAQGGTRRTLAQLVAPSIGGDFSGVGGTVSGDSFTGTWNPPAQSGTAGQITGTVRGGTPTNGDFVPTTFTGLNYPQPGTSGHPGYLE